MVIIMIIIIMRKSAPIFFIKKTAIVNIITILCVLLTQHSRFRLEKKVVTRLLKNFLTFHRILMLESWDTDTLIHMAVLRLTVMVFFIVISHKISCEYSLINNAFCVYYLAWYIIMMVLKNWKIWRRKLSCPSLRYISKIYKDTCESRGWNTILSEQETGVLITEKKASGD